MIIGTYRSPRLLLALFLGLISIGISHARITMFTSPYFTKENLEVGHAKESVLAAQDLMRQRAAFEGALSNARSDFWTQFEKGEVSESTKAEYANLLEGKDYYYLWLEALDRLSDSRGNAPGQMRMSEVIQHLSGAFVKGSLDGGISPHAYDSFDTWAWSVVNAAESKVMADLEGTNKGFLVGASIPGRFYEAITEEVAKQNDLYLKYVEERDISEYLFQNAYSPSRSNDPLVALPAWLLATKSSADIEDANSTVVTLEELVGSAGLEKFLAVLRSSSKLGSKAVREEPAYATAFFDLCVARVAPKVVPLYHIRRKNLCSWSQAQALLEIRRNRYGNKVVDDVIAKLESGILEENGDARGGLLSAIKNREALTDGFESLIERNMVWKDMIDYGSSVENEMELLSWFRSDLKALLKKSEYDEDEVYRKIVESIGERNLVAAAAAHRDFNSAKLFNNGKGVGPDDLKTYRPVLGTIEALRGIGMTTDSSNLFMLTMLADSYEGLSVVRLLKAIDQLAALTGEYGAESVEKTALEMRSNSAAKEQGFSPIELDGEPWKGSASRPLASFLYRLREGVEPTIDLEKLRKVYQERLEAYKIAPTPIHVYGSPAEDWYPVYDNGMFSDLADDGGDYVFVYEDDECQVFCEKESLYPAEYLLKGASSGSTPATIYLVLKVDDDYDLSLNDTFRLRFKELIYPVLSFGGKIPFRMFYVECFTQQYLIDMTKRPSREQLKVSGSVIPEKLSYFATRPTFRGHVPSICGYSVFFKDDGEERFELSKYGRNPGNDKNYLSYNDFEENLPNYREAQAYVRSFNANHIGENGNPGRLGGSDESQKVVNRYNMAKDSPMLEAPVQGKDWIVPGVGLKMKWIKPGRFTMGSPKKEAGRWSEGWKATDEDQFRVTLTRGYWLGAYEVTQEEWIYVEGYKPYSFKNAGLRSPVENVSWDSAMSFCGELTKRDRLAGRLAKGWSYTLPTEAQWEYACRAGTTSAIYTGKMKIKGERYSPELDAIAWYGGNSGVTYEGGYDSRDWKDVQYPSRFSGPHPVGQKAPNAWGLYDMHGNVQEWCLDWYTSYPKSDVVDYMGPEKAYRALCRGGSWHSIASDVRSANRYSSDGKLSTIGFRLALTYRDESK